MVCGQIAFVLTIYGLLATHYQQIRTRVPRYARISAFPSANIAIYSAEIRMMGICQDDLPDLAHNRAKTSYKNLDFTRVQRITHSRQKVADLAICPKPAKWIRTFPPISSFLADQFATHPF